MELNLQEPPMQGSLLLRLLERGGPEFLTPLASNSGRSLAQKWSSWSGKQGVLENKGKK